MLQRLWHCCPAFMEDDGTQDRHTQKAELRLVRTVQVAEGQAYPGRQTEVSRAEGLEASGARLSGLQPLHLGSC